MADAHSLRDFLDQLAGYADRPALVAFETEGARSWDYAELDRGVRTLSAGLQAAGVGPGEPVLLLAENSPEWVLAALALIDAGAIVVPVDAQLRDDDLAHVVRDSGATRAFTDRRRQERLADLTVWLLDGEPEDPRHWRRLVSAQVSPPPLEPAATAVLFYTSGTTGPPKGVPLSHRNLDFQWRTIAATGLVGQGDRVLLPLPLHHVYPFAMGMLTPLALGLPVILPRILTGPEVVRALREGRATVLVGVPRLYQALVEGIETRLRHRGSAAVGAFRGALRGSTALTRRTGRHPGRWLFAPLHRRFAPSLRLAACGGAPLAPELAWSLEGLGWQVAVGYGLTETSPLLTLDRPGESRIGSVGRAVPGVTLRIEPAAAGDGEVQARGPGVFEGYWHNPEQTARAFTADGWFRTGDLGRFDADGYLYVLGRVSTLLVMAGGENIQPEQVEELYMESPVIREAAVLQRDGRLVALLVPDPEQVRRRGGELEVAMREAVAERSRALRSYQRLAGYAITLDALPRTRLGKLRRHLLPALYEEARRRGPAPPAAGPMPPEQWSEADRALLDIPAAAQAWAWLSRRWQDLPVAPGSSLRTDLAVDSVEWLNLTLELGEQAGVNLDDAAINRIDTVRDLLTEVAGAAPGGAPLDQPERVLGPKQQRWLRPLGPTARRLAWGLEVLDRRGMRRWFELQAQGQELLPGHGPYVLAPNHGSFLDPFALAACLDPERLHHTWWGGWSGFAFSNAALRTGSRLARVLPVDPERGVVASLALAAAVLQRGEALVWFPEGTRSTSGELQAFRPGLGLLLRHWRVPVIPVVIRGAWEALPPGRRWPRRRPIRVEFHAPLTVEELERSGRGERPEQRIIDALHQRMAGYIAAQ